MANKSILRKSSSALVQGLKAEFLDALSLYLYYDYLCTERPDLYSNASKSQIDFTWHQMVTVFSILYRSNRAYYESKNDWGKACSFEDYMVYRDLLLSAGSKAFKNQSLYSDEQMLWDEIKDWSGMNPDQFDKRFSPANWQELREAA